MSLKERFIYKGSIGFALGMFITIVLYIINALAGNWDEMAMQLLENGNNIIIRIMIEILTAGLLGIVGNGGSVVYEIESWSILKCTTTHFGFTFLTFYIVAKYNRWMTPGPSIQNAVMISMWLVAYLIIWLVQYLIYKKHVEEINRDMEILKGMKNKEA